MLSFKYSKLPSFSSCYNEHIGNKIYKSHYTNRANSSLYSDIHADHKYRLGPDVGTRDITSLLEFAELNAVKENHLEISRDLTQMYTNSKGKGYTCKNEECPYKCNFAFKESWTITNFIGHGPLCGYQKQKVCKKTVASAMKAAGMVYQDQRKMNKSYQDSVTLLHNAGITQNISQSCVTRARQVRIYNIIYNLLLFKTYIPIYIITICDINI